MSIRNLEKAERRAWAVTLKPAPSSLDRKAGSFE